MTDQAQVRNAVQEMLEAQIARGDPPEVRSTLSRLVGIGYSKDAARNFVACILAIEMRDVIDARLPFDFERYLDNLGHLPRLPGET